jgi:hypothetical protein
MAFEAKDSKEHEAKAFEVAGQLDDITIKNDLGTLEKAIRYMGQNTRDSLKRALEMAERK